MQLISILATSNNGIIGINNQEKHKYIIPWTLPTDMQHFKATTQNNILIMGSKTYNSLPPIFFKDNTRKIIVLTRNIFQVSNKNNVFMGYSKDHAMKIAYNLAYGNDKRLIICGGKEIYDLFMTDITKWIVSYVNTDVYPSQQTDELVNICDILAHIQNDSLKITEIKNHQQNNQDQYGFKIVSYEF